MTGTLDRMNGNQIEDMKTSSALPYMFIRRNRDFYPAFQGEKITSTLVQACLGKYGPCSRTELHSLFGITDSEDDRPKVWRIAHLCYQMKEVRRESLPWMPEPIYSLV